MIEEKKSYFAIIPSEVRYDKSLPMGARMLYGEITALCNEKGYCWATNKYFASLYEVSKSTISVWISQLVEKGYINRRIEYKENSLEIKNRYLEINRYFKKSKEPIENLNTPILKNLKDNNTINNNTFKYKVYSTQNSNELGTPSFSFDILERQIIDCYKKCNLNMPLEEVIGIFKYFIQKHDEYCDFEHPVLSNDSIVEILQNLEFCVNAEGDQMELSYEDYPPMIDFYFDQSFKNCDYSIKHFMSGLIRSICLYKSRY